MKKRLAIVGSGISGMSAAYYLRKDFDVSLFEKNDYLGGHTHTHRFGEGDKSFSLDSGFMVFNDKTYPNMLKMFAELGVEKQKSDMSFSVCNKDSGLEYCSTDLSGIFAQRSNIASPKFLSFLFAIIKFFRKAKADIATGQIPQDSISEYCRKKGLSEYFRDNYLVPMTAAVWSTPHDKILDFPMALLLPFFKNHGLLGVGEQFQWYTVKGGSDAYIKKILSVANFDLHLNEEVLSVREQGEQVFMKTVKDEYSFDAVLLAGHSYASLKIAAGLPEAKQALLRKFDYNHTDTLIHTDASVMPANSRAWASWNQVMKIDEEGEIMASTHYYLNRLQKPNTDINYFCSINPWQNINEDKIVKRIKYRHPLFTIENFSLQNKLQQLNKETRIFFAGAYFGYGFHEDGLNSGLMAVEAIKNIK